jgi:hypothetical protein
MPSQNCKLKKKKKKKVMKFNMIPNHVLSLSIDESISLYLILLSTYDELVKYTKDTPWASEISDQEFHHFQVDVTHTSKN